jgi:hypothetical protein
MTKDEALQLALEALKLWLNHKLDEDTAWEAYNAIKEALETKEGLLDKKSYLLGLLDRKPWVGLTEDEIVHIGVATGLERVAIEMISNKLKEKNHV